MEKLRILIGEETFDKMLSALMFLVIAIILAPMFNLVLLTFLFSFLFFNVQRFVYRNVKAIVPVNEKLITLFIYITFGGILALIATEYIPLATDQLTSIIRQVTEFNPSILKSYLPGDLFQSVLDEFSLQDWIKEGGNTVLEMVKDIGALAMNAFFAFILSFFLLLEKEELKKLGGQVRKSKLAFLCNDFVYFGKNFVNSFGRVMQMQIIIAFVNAALSYFVLVFLGFPQDFGLSFMIFILGLVPVAGVVISFIPLSIIAFNIGGITKVLSVVVMIVGLHGLESYVLNPKLMSLKTKLPVFLVFAILIFSEHTFGPWGLLIGLPLFIFLMDILNIKPEPEPQKRWHFF